MEWIAGWKGERSTLCGNLRHRCTERHFPGPLRATCTVLASSSSACESSQSSCLHKAPPLSPSPRTKMQKSSDGFRSTSTRFVWKPFLRSNTFHAHCSALLSTCPLRRNLSASFLTWQVSQHRSEPPQRGYAASDFPLRHILPQLLPKWVDMGRSSHKCPQFCHNSRSIPRAFWSGVQGSTPSGHYRPRQAAPWCQGQLRWDTNTSPEDIECNSQTTPHCGRRESCKCCPHLRYKKDFIKLNTTIQNSRTSFRMI